MRGGERSDRVVLASVLVMLILLLLAGLWPLDFEPPNGIRWLEPGPGLRLDDRAIAYTEEPLHWSDSSGVALEIGFEPLQEPSNRVAEIVSIYDGRAIAPLLIGQWRSALILRDRISRESGEDAYRELSWRNSLQSGRPHLLAISSDAKGTAVFLDAEPQTVRREDRPLVNEGETLGGQLVVGNSVNGRGAWLGAIDGLALFERALSAQEIALHTQVVRRSGFSALAAEPGLVALYPFDEGAGEYARSLGGGAGALRIPAVFRPLVRERLRLPHAADRRQAGWTRDASLNVLGFVPLGALLMVLGRRRSFPVSLALLGAVTLAGAGLSLAIELIQVYLPDRVSSTTDLAFNTLGVALGASAGLAAHRLRRPDTD